MPRLLKRILRADNKHSSQGVLVYAILLVLGIALSLLIFTGVNATMGAITPLVARARIQAEVNMLGRDGLDTQRQQAMQELEEAGERAVPALIAALHSENAVMRQNAADMLNYIPSKHAGRALRYTLLNDPVPQVRENAAWALGEIQDAATLETLQEAASLDSNEMVRIAAGNSIARFHALHQSTD